VDNLLPNQRSKQMSLIRSKDTKPELLVRRLVHGLGYRYRLHRADLPGTPDLVFPSKKKVIFVHGCFWHGHACRFGRRLPKSRLEYWTQKIQGNSARDKAMLRRLRGMGWKILVLWGCQLQESQRLATRVTRFLDE